jgi:hypothetical protein
MDDPSWTRTTIFDLGSSVCRLFPCKYCRLTIRPRFKRGVCSHLGRLSVTHIVQRRRGSKEKDLVRFVLFFTPGANTDDEHSGSFPGPYSLHAIGISYAIRRAFKIVVVAFAFCWKDRHIWQCYSQAPTASVTTQSFVFCSSMPGSLFILLSLCTFAVLHWCPWITSCGCLPLYQE